MERTGITAAMKKILAAVMLSMLVFGCAATCVSAAAAEKNYLRDSDGSIIRKTGLIKYGNYYYYLGKDYSRYTGFKKIGGKYYYFSASTGRRCEKPGWKAVDGKKYYILKDFSVATGLKTIDKKKYLFSKKGVLLRNRFAYELNGKYYDTDKGGIATNIPSIQAKCYTAAWNYINAHSSSSQSNYERYRSCFNYLESYLNFYSRPRSYYTFDDPYWPYAFALDVFESGLTGDCHGFASCMAVIGKLLGYKPTIFVAKNDHSFVIVDGKFIDNDWGGLFFSTRSHDSYTLDRMVTL